MLWVARLLISVLGVIRNSFRQWRLTIHPQIHGPQRCHCQHRGVSLPLGSWTESCMLWAATGAKQSPLWTLWMPTILSGTYGQRKHQCPRPAAGMALVSQRALCMLWEAWVLLR